MFWGFTYIVVYISSLFLFIAECYSMVWIYHILCACLPTGEYLGCFQFLAMMNKTTMNNCMHMISFALLFSFYFFQ